MLNPIEGAETTLYCCLNDDIENESGEYYDQCKKAKPSKQALSEVDQRRLWEVSEKLVGLKS